jgi:hypothetical protein
MKITIELKDDVATNFATYYGWTADMNVPVADFVTSKLLDRISNDTLELANRTALETVVPVADVTSDSKQTTLREQMATARQVKEAPIETPIEPVKDKK